MCGREQGGENSAEYGLCPAAADPSFDGINSGKCGGRICWAVAGTFCGGCTQGSFVDYMAPEQIDGRPVDQRTDIYALGITAFEMVTGRRPFPEENAKALLDMHLTQDVMDQGHIIPDIPDELRRFILKCARCDPDQRYQDMDQAMAVLRPLVYRRIWHERM